LSWNFNISRASALLKLVNSTRGINAEQTLYSIPTQHGPLLFTRLTKCGKPKCNGGLKKNKKPVKARVWDGARWNDVWHSRKQCKKCCATHRVSHYIDSAGRKRNTLTKENDEEIYLITNYLGFRISYMRQLFHRVYRGKVSLLAECSTILLCYPDVPPPRGSDVHFDGYLLDAFFGYLRLEEGVLCFDVDDPVPDDDEDYGRFDDQGFYTIFDASKHDRGFTAKQKTHVVSDGNETLTRTLCDDEKSMKKGRRGRPRGTTKEGMARRTVYAKAHPKAKPTGRCQVVAQLEQKLPASQNRTEGLFATFDADKATPVVLHVGEMINAECNDHKISSAEAIGLWTKIGFYFHDCGCRLADRFEGVLCDACLLDSWHAKKHKCAKHVFDPKHEDLAEILDPMELNSMFAEQSWAAINGFAKICRKMRRSRYRIFLRHLFIWRNAFSRSAHKSDICPCPSRKKYSREHYRRLKALLGRAIPKFGGRPMKTAAAKKGAGSGKSSAKNASAKAAVKSSAGGGGKGGGAAAGGRKSAKKATKKSVKEDLIKSIRSQLAAAKKLGVLQKDIMAGPGGEKGGRRKAVPAAAAKKPRRKA
jgi:hypothetical protein